MQPRGYSLFDTTIGRLGIAWGKAGLIGVQLPEASERATRERVAMRFPDAAEEAPPAEVATAIDAIRALLGGEARDLSSIPLDMDGVPAFHRRVYEAARAVPAGATLSYGEIAARIGSPGSARAVGQALGKNPFAVVVPCHRVLAAGGKLGGFSAPGGVTTKQRMLEIEREPSGFDASAAVRHLRRADAELARVIDAVGPCRLELKATASVFEALAEAIVYQQLTGKAAATIHGRFAALFPKKRPTPAAVAKADVEALRGAGLSGAKVLALKDLAERCGRGEVPSLEEARRTSDEALVAQLTKVRGVGRWTAEMLLVFRLGRPDVLPLDDYGIKQGFARAFGLPELPSRAELEQRGERWRPYRTAASWYLWRALELAP
jgi:O-6-methylguanine DNA methyltransferase